MMLFHSKNKSRKAGASPGRLWFWESPFRSITSDDYQILDTDVTTVLR
jgi:hypothetical protein